MRVLVTGIGIVSCLGDSLSTWKAICEKKSGIKLQKPFSYFPPLPFGLINSQPSLIQKLTLDLVKQTLESANLPTFLPHTAVVIGSSRGCQSQWEKINRQRIIDNKQEEIHYSWLETLPCFPSALVAQSLQTQAPVLSPMNACATGLVAIAQGYELIQLGLCERVIVGAAETPITPLTVAGFQKMTVLAKTGCYPFDKDREGLVLGEGGAMLVLETFQSALKRGAKIYGEIKGWGMSCDGEKMTAPARKPNTIISMVEKCINRCNLSPSEIDHIHAHGTATCLNDATEAQIINSCFPHFPLVSSTKGAIGHTIGASGAIATALSLISLKQQKTLPNIGLKSTEFNLNLVRKSENYQLKNILNFSFGFGGQNAIIIVSHYPQ